MPVAMHRGTGKKYAKSTFTSMAERWDTEWEKNKDNNSRFDSTPHWYWVNKYSPPPGRLLEAGCGNGQWVFSLNEMGYEVYGIDFAEKTINRARERWPHLNFLVGDLRAMVFDDWFFDVIISLGAIEHDPNGPEAALTEMFRVLKPGGILYCTVPCLNHIRAMGLLAVTDWIVCNKAIRLATGRKPEVDFFEYVFYPDEYGEILRSVGFELIEIAPLPPYPGWRKGPLLSRLVDFIHRKNPFMTCHMIAGVCRKPA